MKIKNSALLLLTLCAPLTCIAQSIAAPELKPGDTWTYTSTLEKGTNGWRQTHEEITLLRTTDSHVYYSSKQTGSTQGPNEVIAGADWSRERNVNGNDVVVNKPLAFPLSTGKSWDVQYTEANPNKTFSSETWDTKYKVGGVETVEVPAGKFQAIKIEAEGDWRAQVAPSHSVVQAVQTQQGTATAVSQIRNTAPATVTGRTYKAFWYAPEVGRWVKSVEEYYGSNGVRSERYTNELESFKHGTE
jgi:hypothetical protein